MTRTYDCTRPWREQLDAPAIEKMIRTYAPSALKRLGLERLLTVKRMIDEHLLGNLNRKDLLTLVQHYDGLATKPTPEGEDTEPSPEEGDPFWDVYSASFERLSPELYRALVKAISSHD